MNKLLRENKQFILKKTVLSTHFSLFIQSSIIVSSACVSHHVFAEEQSSVNVLAPIKVTASKDTQGTAEQGYKEDTVSQVGLWQGRSLQQLPYSIQVFSNDLLKNIQATSNPDEIYRLNPTSQLSRSQYENDQPVTYTRGFRVANAYRDGMEGDQYGHGTTTEDAQKIEVFNGLSGFLYGPGNVGGLINYVTKRSTDTRLNEINLANLGGKSWYAHADFGGKFDDAGKFGYRLNLAKQGGDTAIKQQEIKKDFVSLALDWQALDSLLIQVDAMQRDYDINGGAANWNFAKGIDRLSADRLKNNISWSVPWTNNFYHSERYGAHLKWTPNQNITIRSSYLDSYSRRGTQLTTNTVTSDHTYDQTVSRVYAAGIDRMSSQQYDKRWATYVDFAFDTGQISHKLTTGLQMSDTQQKRYQKEAKEVVFKDLNLDFPVSMPKPVGQQLDRGDIQTRSHTQSKSWLIGDDITLNDQWSLLLGAAYVNIINKMGAGYDESKISPNLSISYRPHPALTTYLTYIESLEAGGIAAEEYRGARVSNAGDIFAPLKSQQIELGAKLSLGDLLLTTALFKIDKGLQYYDVGMPTAPKFVQDGRQEHQGIEFTAIGKATDHLSILGGFTWLDPEIKKQKQNPLLEGKRPPLVAQKMFKLYTEYTVPNYEALSLSAGFNHTAKSYADAENTDKLPAYTLFNVGARYQFDLKDHPMTLRLNINNLFNKHYWANESILGDPRTLVFSSSIKF